MTRSKYRVLSTKVTRRRAIVGAAAVSGGAALLAACGGGDSGDGGSSQDASGLVSKAEDTTKQAKPGGTWRAFTTNDPTTLDILASGSQTTYYVAAATYSRFLKFAPGFGTPSVGKLEPDLMESYEQSADGLQLTFKIRQGMKWDSRAPTNSREIDAEDITYSWEKFARLNALRSDMVNSVSTAAPVQSVTAPDRRTVVVKLAFPYVPALALFASPRHFYPMPREAEGGFNPQNEVRGSGPWVISKFASSVGIEYRKNPNWYGIKDRPFVDGWDEPLISEYAQQLAQFRAKNIFSGAVRQEDILTTKRDIPELRLLQGDEFSLSAPAVFFGFADGSPFLDERVRQAVSHALDRDLLSSVFNNTDIFKQAGIDVPSRWSSAIGPGWDGLWMDPEDEKAAGGIAKYFKYDPAEAKKLVSAAGFPNGITTTSNTLADSNYGADFPKHAEAVMAMIEESGVFKIQRNPLPYATEFFPKIYQGKGNFQGMSTAPHSGRTEIGLTLFPTHHSEGGSTHVPVGSKKDVELDRLIDAQFKEFDNQKRITLIQDIQKHMAKGMHFVPYAGSAPGFSLSWPFAMNIGGVKGWAASSHAAKIETQIHYWIDQTKL